MQSGILLALRFACPTLKDCLATLNNACVLPLRARVWCFGVLVLHKMPSSRAQLAQQWCTLVLFGFTIADFLDDTRTRDHHVVELWSGAGSTLLLLARNKDDLEVTEGKLFTIDLFPGYQGDCQRRTARPCCRGSVPGSVHSRQGCLRKGSQRTPRQWGPRG